MTIQCPCGQLLEVASQYAGQMVSCPVCRQQLIVPGVAPAPQPVAVAAAPAAAAAQGPGILPARFWDLPPPLASAGRASTVTLGILLLCLFFLPKEVEFPGGRLVFLWQAAPTYSAEYWRHMLWSTLALGTLATVGGLFASGALLGMLLGGGVAASLVFAAGGSFRVMGGRGVVVLVQVLALMLFLAAVRLRRMFWQDGTCRLLLGLAAGLMFLGCLLPIEGKIAIQRAVENAAASPLAGPVFAAVAAALFALLALAPSASDTIAVLTGIAEALMYLGLLYVPGRMVFELLRAGPPREILTPALVGIVRASIQVAAILLLGTNAVMLLLGMIPGARVARRTTPAGQPVVRAANVMVGLLVLILAIGATVGSFFLADHLCRGARPEQTQEVGERSREDLAPSGRRLEQEP